LLVILLFYFVPVNISFNYKAFLWLLIPISVGIYYLVISRFFKQFVPVFLLSNGQSLAVQVLQVLSVFFILKALGQTGQELSYILLFLVSSVIAGLPITVGGVGAREMTFLLGAGILGLDTGLSVAVSLMFYLVTASISLCGSYFTFRPGRLALSK